MEVVVLPQALDELHDATGFYDNEHPETAARFIEEVDRVFELLSAHPHLGTPTRRNARRYALGRFPYKLIYRVEPERVVIVAVAHDRRRPWYWLKRIK